MGCYANRYTGDSTVKRRNLDAWTTLGRGALFSVLLLVIVSMTALSAITFEVSKQTITVPEGDNTTIGIRLSSAPLSTTRVRISWIAGDTDISVLGNSKLTFDKNNWSQYQYITLAAAPDADHDSGSAVLRIHRIAGDPISYLDVTAVEEERAGNCVSLPSGWNLISIPIKPTDGSPDVVFDEVDTLYLYSYSGTAYKNMTSNQLSKIVAMEGYWLYLSEPTKVCAEGDPLTGTQAVSLGNSGWHMIGVPYRVKWGAGTGGSSGPPPPPGMEGIHIPIIGRELDAISAGSITVSKGGQNVSITDAIANGWIYNSVWEYGTANGAYTTMGISDGKVLTPWDGYWMLTYEDNLELTFSESAGSHEMPPPPPSRAVQAGLQTMITPPAPPSLPGIHTWDGVLEVTNTPNPITDIHTTVFIVKGAAAYMVETVKVEVYDLAGSLVYSSGEVAGTNLVWHTDNTYGQYLANGVYQYKMYGKVAGQWIVSDVKAVVILR